MTRTSNVPKPRGTHPGRFRWDKDDEGRLNVAGPDGAEGCLVRIFSGDKKTAECVLGRKIGFIDGKEDKIYEITWDVGQ